MKWDKIQFGTLFSTPSKNGIYKSKEFHGAGVKIINMGEIFAFDFIGNQEMQRISMTESEMNHAGVQNGDLLFARRSLVEAGAGKASIVRGLSEPTTYESSIIRVRLDYTKCNPLFYLYWLRSHAGKTAIGALVTGTNVKGIRGSALKEIYVDHPPLPIQNRIVEILSAYDDLIENNQKQIKLLEEAAQRLYKEWFVDFHFPGYETTPIMDGVPEGWTVQTLKNIVPILTGKKDANYGTEDGGYPFFTCAQEPIKAPDYSFDMEAVILAGNGDFNVKVYRGCFEAYQRTYVLAPYKKEHLYLLYHTVEKNMSVLANGASGSTIKFLTKGMIEAIKMYIPREEILIEYNELNDAIQQKIETLKNSVFLATEARDRLLPKLMNGELEI